MRNSIRIEEKRESFPSRLGQAFIGSSGRGNAERAANNGGGVLNSQRKTTLRTDRVEVLDEVVFVLRGNINHGLHAVVHRSGAGEIAGEELALGHRGGLNNAHAPDRGGGEAVGRRSEQIRTIGGLEALQHSPVHRVQHNGAGAVTRGVDGREGDAQQIKHRRSGAAQLSEFERLGGVVSSRHNAGQIGRGSVSGKQLILGRKIHAVDHAGVDESLKSRGVVSELAGNLRPVGDHLHRRLLEFELERGRGLGCGFSNGRGAVRESLFTEVLNRLSRGRKLREEGFNRKLAGIERNDARDAVRRQVSLRGSNRVFGRLVRDNSGRRANAGHALEALVGLGVHKLRTDRFVGDFSTIGLLSLLLNVEQLAGEELFFEYSKTTGAPVLVYRFPNLFGKWCRPNYNSAVATFCHNIANGLPITVNDRATELELLYIDDLVEEMLNALEAAPHRCNYDGLTPVPAVDGRYCFAPVTHKVTLGEIVDLLEQFHAQPATLVVPEIPAGSFAKKLYSTYLSYLPKERIAFPLKVNADERGSFTELLKTENCGQFSVNISKPGITKGQHWHNTKWEFFIVVSGHGLIQERKVGCDEVMEFEVWGDKPTAVQMLPGCTHNIINLSDTENLVTLMWANEPFDPAKPDTFFLKV